MKAETVLKLNGGDIAAAEERCAEWIKAYSAVAEEHPSAEEKAAKLSLIHISEPTRPY